jgi:hypothetical protein
VLSDVSPHVRQELWLQQDLASPYLGSQETAFLKQYFQNRWIGWWCPVGRPPRSLDLTSLDYYYVWERMKPLVLQ